MSLSDVCPVSNGFSFLFKKIYFVDYVIIVLSIFPLGPPPPSTPISSSNPPPPLRIYPWVLHISSLAIPFPILFLTPPVYLDLPIFASYSLHLLPIPPFPFPTDNPPNDLHVYDSVPVLLHCLVSYLPSIIDSCEFIAILMFIVLIFFFFLYDSL